MLNSEKHGFQWEYAQEIVKSKYKLSESSISYWKAVESVYNSLISSKFSKEDYEMINNLEFTED